MKFISIFLLLAMVACGSSENTETQATEAEETQDAETVFDPLLETIDKAKENIEYIETQHSLI